MQGISALHPEASSKHAMNCSPQGACPEYSTSCTTEIDCRISIHSPSTCGDSRARSAKVRKRHRSMGTARAVRTSKFWDATNGEMRTSLHPRPESTQILTEKSPSENKSQNKLHRKGRTYSPHAPPTFFCLSKPIRKDGQKKSEIHFGREIGCRRHTFPELINRGTSGLGADIKEYTN
jgi:hypothetical protein